MSYLRDCYQTVIWRSRSHLWLAKQYAITNRCPQQHLEEKTGMLHAVHMLRRPVVIIWFLALFTTAVSLVYLPPSPLSSMPLIGAGVIVLLLILGDLTSVEL